jgi:hypothetical protein
MSEETPKKRASKKTSSKKKTTKKKPVSKKETPKKGPPGGTPTEEETAQSIAEILGRIPVSDRNPLLENPLKDDELIPIKEDSMDELDKFFHQIATEMTEVVDREDRLGQLDAEKDLAYMEARVAEYLKSFIIIGYDLQGRQIECMHVNTQEEYAACKEALKTTFARLIMGGQQGGAADQGPPSDLF